MSKSEEMRERKAREAEATARLPELFTCRYFAHEVLTSGYVVPVRISMRPPIIPLGYPLEHAVEALMPECYMLGEWDKYSPMYWRKLEKVGVEEIGAELHRISSHHDGLPLALLCYEDVTPDRGHRCHRVVLGAWWHLCTGLKMPELTNDGELLDLHELHLQVQPRRPRWLI